MKDQTVMGLLIELPVWLRAAGWGALSASGLLIGAVGGYYMSLQHTIIARVMTFAAGVLLAVVAVDLVINARGATSLQWTVAGLLCGAAVFSFVNWLLSRRGAQHRKRCGECVEQPEEEQQPGSGLAIAAGTFLDGVPEGVVLGLSVLHRARPAWGRSRRSSWRTSRKPYRAAPECGGRDGPRVTCLASGLESPC